MIQAFASLFCNVKFIILIFEPFYLTVIINKDVDKTDTVYPENITSH